VRRDAQRPKGAQQGKRGEPQRSNAHGPAAAGTFLPTCGLVGTPTAPAGGVGVERWDGAERAAGGGETLDRGFVLGVGEDGAIDAGIDRLVGFGLAPAPATGR